MRFYVKVPVLGVSVLCSLFMFVFIPKSPHLRSKAKYQDTLESDVIGVDAVRVASNITKFSGQTPDPLIKDYGKGDGLRVGDCGRGVVFVGQEERTAEKLLSENHVNVYASDLIALNRQVPDSRHPSCMNITYPLEGLKNVTVVVPFYNEWLSLLLRTVYSVINRTPPSLLREIILVDDGSTVDNLKDSLDQYVSQHFPAGLVRIVRQTERQGLIKARLRGWKEAHGQVLVFLDSHMEMNIDWVQPLLVEIKRNRRTVAMSVLDYIDAKTLKYDVRPDYLIRYGFDWNLVFFEFYFRNEQIGPSFISPRRGVTMVGAAFAVDKEYFGEIGAYDEGMAIWGGENIELSWRVSLCGGQLLHVPCSHMGHIARYQPYSFPAGRHETEIHNYKRAVDVWMGDYRKYVYESYPDMKDVDAGDISERLKLKESLQCKDFSWFMREIWPELLAYDVDVNAWGSVYTYLDSRGFGHYLRNKREVSQLIEAMNQESKKCLDNFKTIYPNTLHIYDCHGIQEVQGFSLTKEGLLRTTMTSVVFDGTTEDENPSLQSYGVGTTSKWIHKKNSWLRHERSGLCLEDVNNIPTMKKCIVNKPSQLWTFTYYV